MTARRLVAALLALLSPMAVGTAAHAAPPQSAFRILNASANNIPLCLGIAGGDMTDGTAALQWHCNGAVDQTWVVAPTDGGWLRLINKATYDNDPTHWSCLGVQGASIAPGARLVIWHCNGSPDQQWSPGPTSPRSWSNITNRNSGLVIAVSGGGTAEGLNIIQWSAGYTGDKLWTYV